MNPELKKPRKRPADAATRKPKEKKAPGEKAGKNEKDDTYLTPFRLFYKELKETNNQIKYHEAQQQYKNLGDHDKLEYINKLIYLNTPIDKVFTADEKKIMKHSNGMPVRPLSAYNAFVQCTIKNHQLGKGKSSMNVISEKWKTLSEEEKQFFQDKHMADLEKWKKDMMAWILTLPMDQRAEQIAKYKLFNKRKRDEEPEEIGIKIEKEHIANMIEIAQVVDDEVKEKSPKKKKLTSESDGTSSSSPSKKAPETIAPMDWDSIFQTGSKSSSPKKDYVARQLSSLGTYPSLTTAHYYMTKTCEGKSVKRVAKGYKELSHAEKKKLFSEMNREKALYFGKLKTLAEKIPSKYNSKVLEFHKTNKEEQEKSIYWRAASGTDKEDDSSSDSSDSDDS